MVPVAVTLDENLVRKVAALKVQKHVFLEIGVFPVPVGKTPAGRGKMSKLVILTDGPTQYAFGAEAIETPDDRETDWTPILESVFKKLCEIGFRPETFASTSPLMEAILQGLCNTDFKGSKVFEHASCDSAKAVFREFSSELFGV